MPSSALAIALRARCFGLFGATRSAWNIFSSRCNDIFVQPLLSYACISMRSMPDLASLLYSLIAAAAESNTATIGRTSFDGHCTSIRNFIIKVYKGSRCLRRGVGTSRQLAHYAGGPPTPPKRTRAISRRLPMCFTRAAYHLGFSIPPRTRSTKLREIRSERAMATGFMPA